MPETSKKTRTFRFDDLAVLVRDTIDNPAEADVDRYVGLEHLDSDSLKIRRWGAPTDVEATKLVFKSGDIIFGKRRAYQRKLAVADFDGICSAHAMVLRAKPDTVLPEFLPFFMQSDLFMARALEISVGSLSPTINWKTLAKQEFALPPLEEQRRIAEVLLAIEATLNKIDDVRHSGFKLWRTLSNEEFGTRANRGDPLIKHYSLAEGQVDPKLPEYADLPLIAPNHIESGTGTITEIVPAREQGAISGKYEYEPGVVLYSKIRPELRKAAIAPCRGICSADMYPLKPQSTLHNTYLLEIILSDEFSRFAISGSMRTGMPKVNRKHLAEFRFDLPSLLEQEEYLVLSDGMHKTARELQCRKECLSALKATLFATVGIE